MMEFESTLEKKASGTSTLTITVSKAQLQESVQKARKALDHNLRTIARSLPGGEEKLRADIEFTQEALEQETTERLAREVTEQVIRERKLRLVANPQVSLETLADLDKPYTYSVDVELVPELELRDYRDLVIVVPKSTPVTDDLVLERIRRMCEDIAPLVEVDRPTEALDVPVITLHSQIEGDEDEEVFEQYAYELGSYELPQSFEAELIGLKAGEAKDFDLVIPADFHNQKLAGKSAYFRVVIEKVQCQQIPLIDNSLAVHLGYTDYPSLLAEMKAYLKNEQHEQAEIAKEQLARRSFADLLAEDVPAIMVEQQARKMQDSFKESLDLQGISIVGYCSYLGITEVSMLEDMKLQANEILRENLALEALFRNENLEINEGELCKTLSAMQNDSGAPADVYYDQLEDEQRTAIYEMTLHRLATEWIFANVRFAED